MEHLMLYAPHLGRCFGLADAEERADCPCPDPCRELCARFRFDPARSPRHETGRGKPRPYTPIPNDISGAWSPPVGPEPNDGVKLTYIMLIQRTLKTRPRWVVDSMAELASQRGTSVKTFRKHCDALRRLGFIETIPYRLLSDDYNMNEHAILLLDLPGWYQTPQDLAEEDDHDDHDTAKEDEDGAAEEDDHDDDDDDLDAAAEENDEGCARLRPRRAVDPGKVALRRAEFRALKVIDAA